MNPPTKLLLLILTDDVGFGASSTFGGPIPTPSYDKLAKVGLRYNTFHTTALCPPSRAALAQVGLPQNDIPMALLLSNVGVEAGQLAFVGAVLAVIALVRQLKFTFPRWTQAVPPYATGSVAMFWVIQRIAVL